MSFASRLLHGQARNVARCPASPTQSAQSFRSTDVVLLVLIGLIPRGRFRWAGGASVRVRGQHPGGADELERYDRVPQPGGVGGIGPFGRQMGDRAVLEFGDDLFDHGVVAVGLVGLDGFPGWSWR
jgi:hypothetical protein